jgi:hypothetical protein
VERINSDSRYTQKKTIYNISSGILLEEVYDTLLDYSNLDYFKRQIKDLVMTVKNGKVISLERKIKFDSIKK